MGETFDVVCQSCVGEGVPGHLEYRLTMIEVFGVEYCHKAGYWHLLFGFESF